MATLLTLSGLLDWDSEVLEGLDFCITNFVDNGAIKNRVVYECGMLECVHQNPETLKQAVVQWVAVNNRRWSRLYETTLYKYDPISNYDRTEEWEDTNEESENQTGSGSNSGNGSSMHNVGAYNNEMQKATEDSATSSSSYNGTGSKETKKTAKHRARIFGNIGVTTTQEMIEAERRVVSFDISGIIANEFRQQFCISVY